MTQSQDANTPPKMTVGEWVARTRQSCSMFTARANNYYNNGLITKKQRKAINEKVNHLERQLKEVWSVNRGAAALLACKRIVGELYAEFNRAEAVALQEERGASGDKGLVTYQSQHRKREDVTDLGYSKQITKYDVPDITEIKSGANLVLMKQSEVKLDRLITKPTIFLPLDVYHKMMLWTRMLKDEITGMGVVKETSPGNFLVEEMFLFDQYVSGARCEATGAEALVALCKRVEEAGYDPANLKCWWHSHNSMGVNPSSQDDETGRNYCDNGYLLSLITNHRGDIYSKINIYKPLDMIFYDIPVYVMQPEIEAGLKEFCKAEVEKYVRTRTITYSYPQHQSQYSGGNGAGFQQPAQNPVEGPKEEAKASPITQAREEIARLSGKEEAELAEEFIGPEWGDDFCEKGVRYKWDKTIQKYRFFNATTNVEITADELKTIYHGALNYNEFPTTAAPQVAEGA